MLNVCKKSDRTPFIRKVMLDMKKMKAELHHHRHYLEQNVERRTEHLSKRIALLESCNATLCDRLAAAQKELTTLKLQQPKHALHNKGAEPNGCALKLYATNS